MNIIISGQSYPVSIKGNGKPCVVIGQGVLLERSLPAEFFDHYKVYFTNLYWVQSHGLVDCSAVTMSTILDDIKSLIMQLGLTKVVMLGHSAFGIVALEFAKKYPEFLESLIIIGTPVNSNNQVAAINDKIFQAQADAQRKQIDAERAKQFDSEDHSALSYGDHFKRWYIYKAAPRYWHQPDYDCSALWVGFDPDRIMDRFFSDILPPVDVTQNLDAIDVPIYNAVGLSDYDCCPWMWRDVAKLPPQMVICDFAKSGHWPQMEEPAKFVAAVQKWMGCGPTT